MGFNSAFKGLISYIFMRSVQVICRSASFSNLTVHMALRRNTNEMRQLLQQAAVSCQYSRYFFFILLCLSTVSNFCRRMISRENLLSQKLDGESDQNRARFEVLTAVLMKFSVFWDVARYVLVYSHRFEYRYVPIYTASLPRGVVSSWNKIWSSHSREY